MTLPGNITKIWVRGRFISKTGAPLTKPVVFTPNAPVMVDRGASVIIQQSGTSVDLDATGAFAVQLIATDDPDVTPARFNYKVAEPTGRGYHLYLPVATPVLNSPGDPLDGQQVVELSDVVPVPGASGGVGQLLRGVGVASMVNDGSGSILVTYTDGSTQSIDLTDSPVGTAQNYAYLVQEIVDRQDADGRLQYEIGKRYQWDPGKGIPETDLSDGVKAKLNFPLSGSGGAGASLGPQVVADRHIARDAGIAESKLALASDAHVAVPSRRTLGRGALQAMPGNVAVPVPGTDVPPLVAGLVPASYLPDGSVAGAPLDTATKPSPLGVPAAGVNVRSSPADHVHPRPATPQPSDHGLIAWSLDPATAAASTVATNGVLQLIRLYIPYPTTVTGIILSAAIAGSGLSNCFTALFDSAKNLLAQSANLATLWGTTTGDKKGDLTAPQTIATPGYVYAGWWVGGGTAPSWVRGATIIGAPGNLNLTGTNLRFATANTGLTATAPSTAGTQTSTNTPFFVGLY